jgi:hypothetical protein
MGKQINRINKNTGKIFQPGEIVDGYEFINYNRSYKQANGYFSESWMPEGTIPIETINPDTGVPFEMYDERPLNPTADGRALPQDGKIFARFVYPKIIQRGVDWHYSERWMTPRENICSDCKKPFNATKRKHRFCRFHRTRKLHRTKDRVEEWNRTQRKPCESSISIQTATGCHGRYHPLKDFAESNSNEGDFPLYCKPCKDETRWRTEIRYTYKNKISGDDYYWMLSLQDDGCYICCTKIPGGGKNHFFVDHQEEPYKIRGLLCSQCNSGIGMLKHDERRLKKAIKYLDENPFPVVRKLLELQENNLYLRPETQKEIKKISKEGGFAPKPIPKKIKFT